MDKGLIDLHIHTTYSKEGITTEPEKIIELAIIKGVNTLAITDHNTALGCIKALKFIERNPQLCKNLRFITGIEISCDTTSIMNYIDEDKHMRSQIAGGVHILGYGIDPYHKGYFDMARFYSSDSGKRTLALYKYLKRYFKIDINKDLIFDWVQKFENEINSNFEDFEFITSSFLYNLLTVGKNAPFARKKQYETFYNKYIRKDYSAYQDFLYRVRQVFSADSSKLDELAKQDIFDMVGLIEDSGGVAIVAHPTFYRPKRELAVADFQLLSEFVERITKRFNEDTGEVMPGIVGIELLHGSSFDDQFRFKFYENLIKNKGLYISGGSDSHINNIKNNNLGYISQNFSIKRLDFLDNLDKLLDISQQVAFLRHKNKFDSNLNKKLLNFGDVDKQAVLYNDYKKVYASEIIESRTISKRLLSFENGISTCLFILKDKLYTNDDVEKNDHKNPDILGNWVDLYKIYMQSIIDNKDVFFGNFDVFYDWLQQRLNFVEQAYEELQIMSKMDANNQLDENGKIINCHFTQSKSTMKQIMQIINTQSIPLGINKVCEKVL